MRIERLTTGIGRPAVDEAEAAIPIPHKPTLAPDEEGPGTSDGAQQSPFPRRFSKNAASNLDSSTPYNIFFPLKDDEGPGTSSEVDAVEPSPAVTVSAVVGPWPRLERWGQ